MIPLYQPHVPAGVAAAVQDVLASKQIAGDGRLPGFEDRLREFVHWPHVSATAEFSRTVEMVLRLAGVGAGDAVLVSPLACLATTMPILQVGARPVWCDLHLDTGGIAPDEIARRHSSRTKAALLYHWVGIPGDIRGVQQAAAPLGLPVIEDANEALGAEYDGRPIGAHGSEFCVFSFSPVRLITTGEGAAVASRDEELDRRVRLARRYGIPEQGFRDALGEIAPDCDISTGGTHNYMNRIAGAIGALQMNDVADLVARQRSNGAFYDEQLASIPGITRLLSASDRVPSYWVYCFRCERRNDLRRALRDAGIYASTVHMRTDHYTCFGAGPADLPGVEEFERTQLCIPSGWWVSNEDREYVVDAIRRGW